MNTKWIVFAIIVVYGYPLWMLRYKFRSAVYKDTNWKINFRPWVWWEIQALFSDKYFKTKAQKNIGRTYRWYLIGFALLWVLFLSL